MGGVQLIACTKCGNDADPDDSVCLVCGGFLAGNQSSIAVITDPESGAAEVDLGGPMDGPRDLPAGEAADPQLQTWWPALSRLALLAFYVAFVIAVAVAVNWLLRRL